MIKKRKSKKSRKSKKNKIKARVFFQTLSGIKEFNNENEAHHIRHPYR